MRLFKSYEEFKEKIHSKAGGDDFTKATILRNVFVSLLEEKYKDKNYRVEAVSDDKGIAEVNVLNQTKIVEEYVDISLFAESTYLLVWELFDSLYPEEKVTTTIEESLESDAVILIPVGDLSPNPEQPRTNFDRVTSIAQSIKEKGQLDAIKVIKVEGKYIIVDGECRWRAVKQLGHTHIRAEVFKQDIDLLDIAVTQMSQRSNMNPVDWANAFVKINKQIKETNAFAGRTNIITQAEFDKMNPDPYSMPKQVRELIKELYGVSDGTIYNSINILKQPLEMQERIAKGKQEFQENRFTVSFDKNDFPSEFRKALVDAERKSKVMQKVEREARDLSSDDTKYLSIFLPMEKLLDKIKKEIIKINMDNVSEKTRDDIKERYKVFVKELSGIVR
jgi:hypothetical protein